MSDGIVEGACWLTRLFRLDYLAIYKLEETEEVI
jgi:hypothetical protein